MKRKILKLTSIFLLTVQIAALLIALPPSMDSVESGINNPDFIDQESTTFNEDLPVQAVDTKGLVETLNFIPLDGERFSHSLTGDPLWTYPAANSYLDTFWQDTGEQKTTADQIWNPESGQIVSTDSIPPSASGPKGSGIQSK
ncbi:MAG: hypothetical protein ACTSRK_09265 [Promethearchaeota archaeon]